MGQRTWPEGGRFSNSQFMFLEDDFLALTDLVFFSRFYQILCWKPSSWASVPCSLRRRMKNTRTNPRIRLTLQYRKKHKQQSRFYQILCWKPSSWASVPWLLRRRMKDTKTNPRIHLTLQYRKKHKQQSSMDDGAAWRNILGEICSAWDVCNVSFVMSVIQSNLLREATDQITTWSY